MDALAAIGVLAVGGLLVGLLARLAIPGPDPMPIWLTIVLGGVGTLLGASVGYGVGAELGAVFGSVLAASLLLILYRRVVQRRGVTGPHATLAPTRGPGVRRWRRKRGYPADNALLEQLVELKQRRRRGEISKAEFKQARSAIQEQLHAGR